MEAVPTLTFGDMLRRYRVAAGLTQEELAERAGVSTRGISDLERGVKAVPRKDTVHLLAAALQLTPEDRALFDAARKRGAVAAPDRTGISVSVGAPPRPGVRLPPFVGRRRDLEHLERHLRGQGPPLLLLAGEPGIGKSRLLRVAAERARDHAWRVLEGGCQRRGGQESYAPLLDALAGHLRIQTPAQLRADLRGCAWLVRLLPELAGGPIEPLPGWTLPPEQERRLLFAAAGRFLANVAGPAGTLLLLDDLHWAGADALDLLTTVVRSTSVVGLRLVGAYRDTEVQPGDDLSTMLADLAQAGLATQRTLAPLTPEETGQLLDGLLDGADDQTTLREQVVQRTGGVPFFVVSCAQTLRLGAGTEDGADTGGAERVPWDVAQGIRQRVAALSEVAREVLGVASVLGRVVQPPLLTAVAEQPERAVLAALDAASQARLLVEDGQTYQFAHDLIREVVEADVGVARRLWLHRRVAQVLEEAPGTPPLDLLAYHYSRSGEHGKAAAYLEQAGDRAVARAAHAAAEGYYREAVERMEGLGWVHAAAGVREKLGAVLLTAARYGAALAALEPAAEACRCAGDLEGEGRVTAQIGLAYGRHGKPVEGLARLQPVLERLDAGDPSVGLARLYLALAYLYHFTEQPRQALVAAERASALAAALGDNIILGEAEAVRGVVLDYLGRVEEALLALAGAINLTEATGQVFWLCDALNMTAHIYDLLGQFAQARPCIDRALAVAERAGDQYWIAFLPFHLGFIAFYAGDWAQARRYGERAAELLGQIGASWSAGYGALLLGLVGFGEGRWEEAVSYLEHAVQLQERTSHREAIRIAQSVLAELEILQGRAGDARARLLPLLPEPRPERRDSAFLLPKLAWAHLEEGQAEVAMRVADEAVAYARAKSDRLNLVEALRVQALVTLRREHWLEAERALDEALSLAQSMRYPWGEARVLSVYGDLRTRTGEPTLAREHLEAALAIFQRLGARKDVAWVEQAIGGLSQNGTLTTSTLLPSPREL